MNAQHHPMRKALMAAVLFAAAGTALAQTSSFPAESRYRNSGNRPYVVVRGDLNDFTGKRDPVVADFDSEMEARKAAQALNDALKGGDVFKYLYTWRKRKADDAGQVPPPDPGTGKKIETPKPKFVDPGALKKEAKGSVLAGKKGNGTIGDAKVTMEFSKTGDLIISGELEGSGKWSETESGGVYLQTAVSTFRGNIKGQTVSGLRFTKDNSKPATEWRIELQEASKDVANPPAQRGPVGMWDHPGKSSPTNIQLNADGTGTYSVKLSDATHTMSIKWTMTKNALKWFKEDADSILVERTGGYAWFGAAVFGFKDGSLYASPTYKLERIK